jgi:hypothetical protein
MRTSQERNTIRPADGHQTMASYRAGGRAGARRLAQRLAAAAGSRGRPGKVFIKAVYMVTDDIDHKHPQAFRRSCVSTLRTLQRRRRQQTRHYGSAALAPF